MVEKIAQHTHCHMCGKAIPANETLCSEECKQKYQNLLKKRRRYIYIMYGAIAVMVIVLILSSMMSSTY
ncbi:MAG: DUF2116 family Zn-ribbon domain-containing protein [Candidatus Thermoplasmatota archaeon]|jgi:predicted nucleic acid-binding Zn ribbon protein|nr:DUF2116 family Zn-ribbon domain-containing protein [Candidatus Thermoplasmatota archaeon]